jgi:hypothetical protein
MFRTRHDDKLRSFLSWRKKTRFIRHYGGPLLALVLLVVCVQLLWRIPRHRHNSQPATENKKVIDAMLSQKTALP